MPQIHILTGQRPRIRGFNDFFPLFKWATLFKKNGIAFRYFYNHLDSKILEGDLLIVDFRYLQWVESGKIKIDGIQPNKGDDFFIYFLENARRAGMKIVLFDTNDGGGSNLFHITPYVDIHLKKQLYRDLTRYTQVQEYNFMPWLPAGKGLLETKKRSFTPLNESELHKLRVGWNIGLCDYRHMPLEKWLPVSKSFLLPGVYHKLQFREPQTGRDILIAYRGASNILSGYDYQRNLLIDIIQKLPFEGIRTGGKVPFSEYQRELNNARFGISPFGWGEICYRDFEIILNGALLIKPSLDHLKTFPEILVPYETYLPCKWDFSDIQDLLQNYTQETEAYNIIAREAQRRFLKAQTDGLHFVNHFKEAILN